jgi:hypothetical protein
MRTSENSSSTTFVYKGKKRGRSCLEARPRNSPAFIAVCDDIDPYKRWIHERLSNFSEPTFCTN